MDFFVLTTKKEVDDFFDRDETEKVECCGNTVLPSDRAEFICRVIENGQTKYVSAEYQLIVVGIGGCYVFGIQQKKGEQNV